MLIGLPKTSTKHKVKRPALAKRGLERGTRRVKWPNGNPVADAPVCTAYEHTKDYDPLNGTECYSNTDQHGTTTIHLYGNSRVRLFAEQFVHNNNKQDRYYSSRMESEADKMSDKVSLVLNAPKP
jgi:hypothetical protein